MKRRHFLLTGSAAVTVPILSPAGAETGSAPVPASPPESKPRFQFSVKWGAIREPGLSVTDKFRLLKDLGYDGVEMDSQFVVPVAELLAARDATGLPVHGVVNANHWAIRLSDPTPDIRAVAVQELLAGLRFARETGASTLMLVPGAVRDGENENKEQVWERSLAGIREAIPLAAELGVRIGIANVWNGFLYQHGENAPDDQKPDGFIRFVDTIGSASVGLNFDLGNHCKYSDGPGWIRAMGSRIIKCDARDYLLARDAKEGRKEGFCDMGDGSVDWAGTRQALADINYAGWIGSEVTGGNLERLADHLARLRKHLLAV